MKHINYLLALGFVLLGQVSCGSKVKDQGSVTDDGALVPELAETGATEGVAEVAEPKKGRWGLRRKRDEAGPAANAEVAPAKPAGPAGESPEKLESRARDALAAAKVHCELGDYDFAIEELEKIGKGAAEYAEAQRLLGELLSE